ncbi:MAG: hypothetical protein AAGF23_20170 [Acidobacteriota bacterium]
MTDRPKCTPPPDSASLESIFASDFLELVGDDSVDGFCEHEAGFTGPWRVEAQADGFAVIRDGEAKPRGLFKHHETACLVAAVLPAVGSDPLYAVRRGSSELVRTIGHAEPTIAGQLSPGDEDLAGALHIAAWLLRSPHSLAFLLEAAGYDVLATAGRLVAYRKAASPAS